MRTLLWIGNPFFSANLKDHGWELFRHIPGAPEVLDWEAVLGLTGGRTPDVLVLSDKSYPPQLVGLEAFPCLTVFHCIDSHIHSWYPRYAQAFDLCALSLRDHLPLFRDRLGDDTLLWLPPFARDDDRPLPADKEWDLLFAGTIDPETTPGRHEFMRRLRERLPSLETRRGDYRALFPRARLALNYAERGDLNFRVFEALACGACLLTPRVGHGLEDLFGDGEDLFVYPPDDMDRLVQLVRACLARPDLCERVAANGLRKIDRGHRARHRAAQLDAWVRGRPAEELIRGRLSQARDIHSAHLKLLFLHFAETISRPDLREAYLRAGRRATPTGH